MNDEWEKIDKAVVMAEAVRLRAENQRLVESNERFERVRQIMRQRKWFPRFCGALSDKQRWKAYSWMGCKDVDQTIPVVQSSTFTQESALVRECPFECIEAAEEWWQTNVAPLESE